MHFWPNITCGSPALLPVLHHAASVRAVWIVAHSSSFPCPQHILNVIGKQTILSVIDKQLIFGKKASLHSPHNSAMSPDKLSEKDVNQFLHPQQLASCASKIQSESSNFYCKRSAWAFPTNIVHLLYSDSRRSKPPSKTAGTSLSNI